MDCFPYEDMTKREARITEEGHFHRLFQEVLDYLKDEHSIEDCDIRPAIEALITSFRYGQAHRFREVDLTQPDNMCGYLHRYAIHGAGLMRHKTLQAFHDCPVLRRTLRQPELSVVSLGGGPGNDVVGFLSALHQLGPRGCELRVTVVDAVWEWAQCLRLVKHFARVGSFGGVSKMFRENSVDFQFVQTMLPGHTLRDEDCYSELGCADVVVISKLISVMNSNQKKQLIDNLFSVVKESALILLVDCPFKPYLWEGFDLLYLSRGDEKYQLHLEELRWNPHYHGLSPVVSQSRIAVLRRR